MYATAAGSPSISAEPNPQFHIGTRTLNGSPSGTSSFQVSLAPLDRTPLVTVWQPLRPQSWPYEVGVNVELLSAPARYATPSITPGSDATPTPSTIAMTNQA
jgi:hypothetical protein